MQIVRNQQNTAIAFIPNSADQVVEFNLSVDIDIGGRLIQDQQVRVAQQSAGQQNPFLFTARK